MRRQTFALLIVLAVAASAGCGGGGATSGFSTGLDGSKILGTLTPTEVDLLCKASEDYSARTAAPQTVIEQECRGEGILQAAGAGADEAQMRSVCQTTYDACIRSLLVVTCRRPTAACAGTVAEYEACYQQIASIYGALPSCDKLAAISSQILTGASPAACQAFATKCPDMVSSGSSAVPAGN